MSKYTQMAESVRNLAKQYKSVVDMGEFLNDIGAHESHAIEVKRRVEKLNAEETEATLALARAQAAVADVEAEAQQIRDQARAEATAVAAAAHDDQVRILSDARAEAERIVGQALLAEQDTLARAATVEKRIASEQSTLVDLDTKIAAAEDKLNKLNTQLAALRAKLDS